MDLQAKKLDLIRWLTSLNDVEIVHKLYKIKSKNVNDDWFDNLSTSEKTSISKGLEDLKEGRIISHEKVMESVSQKISELKNN